VKEKKRCDVGEMGGAGATCVAGVKQRAWRGRRVAGDVAWAGGVGRVERSTTRWAV
jgi:hypothetical protein